MISNVSSENLIFINNLNSASDRLAVAMNRLSTGARVNCAADDAAGFMISKGLEVKQRGLNTANDNIQTGLSLLGVAEGSLQTMLSPLYRIRDLALQSSNGIYSEKERQAMQLEVDALFDEIVRTKNTTEFNGVKLFSKQVFTNKDDTFVDNETAATISLMSYTPAPMMLAAAPATTSEPAVASIEEPMMAAAPNNSKIIEGAVTLASGKSKTISIGDKVYTFTDNGSGKTNNTCNYSYDMSTGKLTLTNTNYMTIRAADGQVDDIYVENAKAYTYVYAGDKNDKIEITGSAGNVRGYGEAGDDYLIDNTTNTSPSTYTVGGLGDDIIEINKSNGLAYGSEGNDTFYITGDNNTVHGQAGDDNFHVLTGDKNFLNGGLDTNTIIENMGTNTGWNSISGIEDYNTTQGKIHVGSQEVKLYFNGKQYTVKNSGSVPSVEYSYNETTDTVTFSGSSAHITATGNQTNNIILATEYMIYTDNTGGSTNITANKGYATINIGGGENTIITKGNNSTIKLGNGNNTITSQGTYTNITLGNGENTVTSSGANSKIISGTGENTIKVNGASSFVQSKGGDDEITLNSNNNYVSCANSGTPNITINSGKTNNIINGANNSNLLIEDNGTTTGYLNCNGIENYLPNSGTIYLKASESLNITLMKDTANEASYTVKNRSTSASCFFTYSCNTTTGEITFNSGNDSQAVTITAFAGQNDKIIAQGNALQLYTGDGEDTVNAKVGYYSIIDTGDGNDTLNITSRSGTSGTDYPEYYTKEGADTVTISSGVGNIDVWTGDGDDTITINGTNNKIYSEAGADTIVMNGVNNTISSGNHNDTVTLNASNVDIITDLGAGSDTININANNTGSIMGGDGNDNFVIASGVTGVFVDGNAGTNTIIGDGSSIYRYNVENYPNLLPAKGAIAIAGSSENTIEILGQVYTIKNRQTTSSILKFNYNETTGLMTFEGTYLNITSAAGQVNNVIVKGNNMYFYGSDENDTIEITGANSMARGQGGNDIIKSSGNYAYSYGGAGDDIITVSGVSPYAYGEAGNDTITANGDTARIYGNENNDTITLNGESCQAWGGAGDDTIESNGGKSSVYGEDDNDTINLNGAQNHGEGGAGDDTITASSGNAQVLGGEGNDTITLDWILGNTSSYVKGEGGDDIITVNSSNNVTAIEGGDGDDKIIMNGENNSASGGAGYNTLELNVEKVSATEFNKIITNKTQGSITLEGGEELALEISGKSYTIENLGSTSKTLEYDYDEATETMMLDGDNFKITSALGQVNNVVLEGNEMEFIGSDGNDTITVKGNDSTIQAKEGDDRIIVIGERNTVSGGTGSNTLEIAAKNITFQSSEFDKFVALKSEGTLSFEGNDSATFEIAGKSYEIKNLSAGIENLNFYYNDANNTITFEGNNFEIKSNSGQANKVILQGNGIEFWGAEEDDRVTLRGSNAKIYGNEGADTILAEGNENNIELGAGNDNITILGNSNTIDGGEGYDIIANSGTNTTISNCSELWKEADPFSFQVGTEANEISRITVSTGFTIPVIGIDISSAYRARMSLEDIDNLIGILTGKMADIGVSVNRLKSAMNSNEITQINMTASRSSIIDADIARESMNLLKEQILQNASASVLSTSKDLKSTSLLNIYDSISRLGM